MAPLPRRRTEDELHILAGLQPHTRLHAIALVAEHPSLTLTSGRRSRLRNRQVGGVKNSWHLRGRAVDFDGTSDDLAAAWATARDQRLSSTCTGPEEVLLEHVRAPGEHLHVAW